MSEPIHATASEALAFNRRSRDAVSALLHNRARAASLDARFAVIAASAREAGYSYSEMARALDVSPATIPAAIDRHGAEPDPLLVRFYREARTREPGLGLNEAAAALSLTPHAIMARARAGTIETIPGKRGRRYLLPETTNGSVED
jgi:hypothetical protein